MTTTKKTYSHTCPVCGDDFLSTSRAKGLVCGTVKGCYDEARRRYEIDLAEHKARQATTPKAPAATMMPATDMNYLALMFGGKKGRR